MRGKIIKGKDRGAFYIEKYKEKFRNVLGYTPYYGTLNIECDPKALNKLLSQCKPLIIPAYSDNHRTYGKVTCFKVQINNILNGAIVKPEKARHKKVIAEVVAPISIKERFKLIEGDYVQIQVHK